MTSVPPQSAPTGIDTVGAVCSSLCAVHCAATATAPALLTALGVGTLVSSAFEWGASAMAVSFGLIALVVGRRRHGARWVSMALAVGIAGLVAGRLLEMADVHGVGTVLSIVAGLCLAMGHIAGIVLSRRRAPEASSPGTESAQASTT